jgi:predicted enzyme related to lactoylglutathione lyase
LCTLEDGPENHDEGERNARENDSNDLPQFFRLNVEVGNLDEAIDFYTKLLDVHGRKQPGSCVYFDCGPVIVSLVDVSAARAPSPAAKALYFTVRDLDAAFSRAQALGGLSQENVHDAPGGGIVVRPWGERSFYAEDPWGNPLCFIEERTVYRGT